MAKEMTMEEVRSKVIQTVWNDIDYWERQARWGQRTEGAPRRASLQYSGYAGRLCGRYSRLSGYAKSPPPGR